MRTVQEVREFLQRAAGSARAVHLLALLLLLGIPPAARGDDDNQKEARVRVVTTWDAGCSSEDRNDWDNMGEAWYDEISDDAHTPWGHGSAHWSRSGMQVNGNIVDSDFVDPDNETWGNDTNQADAADALWVGMHGGNNSTDHRWRGSVRVDEAGTGNCGTYQGHIELGDTDLEYLVLSSCHSMDYEDWWNEWNSSFDGLHQIDGFHGNMYISYTARWDYRQFVDDAFNVSMADSWVDNLYHRNYSGSSDQCPVARVVGTSQDDCRYRLDHERYNNFLSDPPGLGYSRAHRARYVIGCDPSGGDALP